MSDLINRQDVIDALGEEPEVWDDADEFANGMRMQWNCDRKAIEALPSIRTQMSSADCISRQDAIDALRTAYWDKNIQSAKDDPCIVDAMTDWAIRKIKGLPSAEPEIIRCKDCEYFHNYCGHMFCTNSKAMFDVRSDYYCSFAERRQDEHTD